MAQPAASLSPLVAKWACFCCSPARHRLLTGLRADRFTDYLKTAAGGVWLTLVIAPGVRHAGIALECVLPGDDE